MRDDNSYLNEREQTEANHQIGREEIVCAHLAKGIFVFKSTEILNVTKSKSFCVSQ
jgi:hypothetical protein